VRPLRAERAILEEDRQRLEELERGGKALMERYAGAVPEAPGNLLPEERLESSRCSG
jgi:hypothetical protein